VSTKFSLSAFQRVFWTLFPPSPYHRKQSESHGCGSR